MTTRPRTSLVRHFRTLFEIGPVAGLTDGQLLERFLERRDEAGEIAFAALVDRHGAMVLGVCRRALPDPNDAADAFQATFLVLVRKARSIQVDDSLGRWLYGVSRRVAARARKVSARRPSPISHEPETVPTDPDRFEFATVLDEELARLPDSFRSALVLCDLGGLTHDEAARDLRCPVGTIKSRLARGRKRLRDRLERRGFGLSLIGLAPQAVPASLASSTLRLSWMAMNGGLNQVGTISTASVMLAQGVLKAMAGFKLKMIVGTMLIGLISAGGGVAALSNEGSEQAPVEKVAEAESGQKAFPRAEPSRNLIELGRQCFPNDHWVNADGIELRYSNANQEAAIYSQNYKMSEDQKQIHLSPFALARISNDGKSRGIFTSDGAILSLVEPFDPVKQGTDLPRIRHIRMTGNATVRTDNGQNQNSPSEMRADALDLDRPFDKPPGRTTFPNPAPPARADFIPYDDQPGRHVVHVMNDSYRFDGSEMELADTTSRLKELLKAKDQPKPWVFMRITKETRLDRIQQAVKAVTDSGPVPIRFIEPESDVTNLPDRSVLFPSNDKVITAHQTPEGDRKSPRKSEEVSAPGYHVQRSDLIRLEVVEALPGRPISGIHEVGANSKISLGSYGEVQVGGLTLAEIKEKVILHLQQYLDDETLGLRRKNLETGKHEVVSPRDSTRVFVDPAPTTSKFYRVIGEVGRPGRLPITGNVTVLDALNFAGGTMAEITGNSIRLIRASYYGAPGQQILAVDLDAIVNRGDTKTNYQLMADDLLVVYRNSTVAQQQAPATKPMRNSTADLELRLQTVERKLDEVHKILESLPRR